MLVLELKCLFVAWRENVEECRLNKTVRIEIYVLTGSRSKWNGLNGPHDSQVEPISVGYYDLEKWSSNWIYDEAGRSCRDISMCCGMVVIYNFRH